MPSILCLISVLFALQGAYGQGEDHNSADKVASPIRFIKLFHTGMTFSEVQKAMPKTVEQDLLSYNASDNVFVLGVESPGAESWSACFVFDTGEATLRRPERLIEMNCSTTLSDRVDTFDSLVRKVSGEFGNPVKLDRSQGRIQKAGWRVSSEAYLTLEYTEVPGASGPTEVLVDFVVKSVKKVSPGADPVA